MMTEKNIARALAELRATRAEPIVMAGIGRIETGAMTESIVGPVAVAVAAPGALRTVPPPRVCATATAATR